MHSYKTFAAPIRMAPMIEIFAFLVPHKHAQAFRISHVLPLAGKNRSQERAPGACHKRVAPRSNWPVIPDSFQHPAQVSGRPEAEPTTENNLRTLNNARLLSFGRFWHGHDSFRDSYIPSKNSTSETAAAHPRSKLRGIAFKSKRGTMIRWKL
jgi:hypothetical protein